MAGFASLVSSRNGMLVYLRQSGGGGSQKTSAAPWFQGMGRWWPWPERIGPSQIRSARGRPAGIPRALLGVVGIQTRYHFVVRSPFVVMLRPEG
jgi:hypothetical protein